MKPKIKMIDCSLRDGGYHNDWEFTVEDAQEYLNAMGDAGVEYVEIGFRFSGKNKFQGPFAYTRETVLEALDVPSGITLGVMVNASDFLSEDGVERLAEIFVPAAESKAGLVRIAAQIHQVKDCGPMVSLLMSAGYRVGFNIMQVSEADDATIAEMVAYADAHFGNLAALYFADSLGKMTPDDVRRFVTVFRENTDIEVGFHGHDNMGLGVVNSLEAIEAGATWVDGTVTGIGRGAGNTQTEYLANELNRVHDIGIKTVHINKIALGWLGEMKARCGWGTNILYYEAAQRSIHPTYVQEMIEAPQYSDLDVLNMIYALRDLPNPTSFKAHNIDLAFSKNLCHAQGYASLKDAWAGRPVLLVGSGEAARNHLQRILDFADVENAVVIAVNHVPFLHQDEYDYLAALHPARVATVLDKGHPGAPLLTSVQSFDAEYQGLLAQRGNVIDFGAEHANGFSSSPKGCVIPLPLTLPYAIAAAEAGGATEVMLAGFDGLDGMCPRFREMNDFLKSVRIGERAKAPLTTLTKTHFDLPVRNIYGA